MSSRGLVSRLAIIITSVALLLLVMAPAALAAVPYAVPTPVCTDPGTQSSPVVSGGWDQRVTWESNPAAGQWDIFSLFRNVTALVPAGPSAQRRPAAENYVIVYEDDRGGDDDWDIFLYDTFPGDAYKPAPAEPELRLTDKPGNQRDPDISNGRVVYEDDSRGNWDIAVYDVAAGTSRFLTSNRADQVDPAISGTKVVWADRRNGNWDIYCYDLAKKTLKRLTTSKAAQTRPRIGDDGIVVFQDKRNGDWDVYAYYLKTGKTRRLTTEGHNQTAPDIAGGRSVVYEDGRGSVPRVWVCDLQTGINRKVTDAPAGQSEPSVDEATVAWRDKQGEPGDVYTDGGLGDIYQARLTYPTLSLRWDTADTSTPPAYDSTLKFAGGLRLDYASVEGLRVVVSGTEGTRKVGVTPSVDPTSGSFRVTLRHVTRKVTLRALFNDPGHLPDSAGPVSVKPKAMLTRPSFTVLPRKSPLAPISPRDTVVTGYLKPRHASGSKAVTIQCWRYVSVVKPGEDPHWELAKTVRAAVSNYSSYSRYRARISLAFSLTAVRWKVRVVHSDADHAKTESSFSAVRSLLT